MTAWGVVNGQYPCWQGSLQHRMTSMLQSVTGRTNKDWIWAWNVSDYRSIWARRGPWFERIVWETHRL